MALSGSRLLVLVVTASLGLALVTGVGVALVDEGDTRAGLSASFDDDDSFDEDDGGVDLDALHEECEDGDMVACDELYLESEDGSGEEEFGSTCGERSAPTEGECAEGDSDFDRDVDILYQDCDGGDMEACDELYFETDPGTDEEEFGSTCGGRREPTEGECAE